MIRIPCAVVLLGLALLAAAPAARAEDELRVANPWVSLPILDEGPRVYFAIQNPTGKPQRIVGATSPRCRSIELRLATVAGGAESSKKLDEIEIPAAGAVAFSARGYFLELVGAEKLAEQDRVPIELELAGGAKLRFEAEARDE